MLFEGWYETGRTASRNSGVSGGGGELCIPGHSAIRAEQVTGLEEVLDEINPELKPLEEFILPGGSQSAAFCHLARAVCRRAERRTVTLAVSRQAIQYLNRLSDLLFILARNLNRVKGIPDILWDRSRFT